MKTMADSLGDLGWPVEDRILVLNVLRGLSDRYAHLRTWITRQRPFPTFFCRYGTILSWRSSPRASSRGLHLGLSPQGPRPPRPHLLPLHRRVRLLRLRTQLSVLGPLPLGPSGGVGGGACWSPRGRGGGRGGGAGCWGTPALPPPRGATWPSFHNPWSGRISMWPFQALGGEPRSAAMLAGAPPGFYPVLHGLHLPALPVGTRRPWRAPSALWA